MAPSGIFITGTSTDIGKTLVAAMMMAAAKTHQIDLRYFKPIQTGSDIDHTTVKNLADLKNEYIVEPLFHFKLAAAPSIAALAENKEIDMAIILSYFKKIFTTAYLVEGAGGLLVPLTKKLYIRDLVEALKIPLLIVASTRLGTINHTLLTIEAAQSKKIPIKGLILSGPPDAGLSKALPQLTSVPVLAEIPWLDTVTPSSIQKIAPTIFNKPLLQRILS